MKSKVVLIQPNYNIKTDAVIWAANPPIGLCYLAAVLEKENIPVKIIDAHVNNLSINQVTGLIKKSGAKYVGFSILTPAADWCTEVVKKLPSSITKIAGGPHASGLPEETLKSGFDIVVVGEGEQTLLEIAQDYPYKNIRGICYRQGKRTVITPSRPPLDPNTIPFPARHLILNGGTNKPYSSSGTRYFPWSPIFTSRGCPYQCYFCNKNIFGSRFRPRKAEDVVTEIDELVKNYHVKEINVYDDNFNFDIKRAEKILDLIIERKYRIHIRFSNGIRADKVNLKLLSKMKKAGTDYIAYGIESGDPKILKQIPKGETLGQIRKAVLMTHQSGIPVTGFFILGLIGDTIKSMQNTINFTTSLPFDNIILNIATPFPGTRMWQIIQKLGGEVLLSQWKDFHSVSGKMQYSFPGMATPQEVEEMYRKAYRAFYFRPKFMIRQLPKLLSPSYIPIIYRGLMRIFYSLRQTAS